MKLPPLLRRAILAGMSACLLLALALIGLRTYLHSPSHGLPYRDSFARGKADEWRALGGTWELVTGMMRNGSDERGAKLVTGSPYWRNYSIDADVYLLGVNGDAGLIIRSGAEEEGVNSYSGYYAGVRTIDNSLVLGRAEHGWVEVNKQIQSPGGVRPGQWYHLKLLAYDCQIAASVTALPQGALTSLGVKDSDCIHSGRIGLRSYSSGGIWRNVVVRLATNQDLAEMLKSTGGREESTPENAANENTEFLGLRGFLEQERASPNAGAQSIESLRLTSSAKPATATVRGVVILTAPRLFVQD